MAAKNRNIAAVTAIAYGMPDFVLEIQKIQVVNCSRAFPVSLHTGDAAVFAAVAFILIDNYSFHADSPLDFQGRALFLDDSLKQVSRFLSISIDYNMASGKGLHVLAK
jgi:hypothetical protein